MAFVKFTRPDNSVVIVNREAVISCAPLPGDGPLKQGTRINFGASHQDVTELVDEVARRLNA